MLATELLGAGDGLRFALGLAMNIGRALERFGLTPLAVAALPVAGGEQVNLRGLQVLTRSPRSVNAHLDPQGRPGLQPLDVKERFAWGQRPAPQVEQVDPVLAL